MYVYSSRNDFIIPLHREALLHSLRYFVKEINYYIIIKLNYYTIYTFLCHSLWKI